MFDFGSLWPRFCSRRDRAAAPERAAPPPRAPVTLDLAVAPDDPLVHHFQANPGVVDVDMPALESPALAALREAGLRLIVPLVSRVDDKVQWPAAGNVWHNAAVRSARYAPIQGVRRLCRRTG